MESRLNKQRQQLLNVPDDPALGNVGSQEGDEYEDKDISDISY